MRSKETGSWGQGGAPLGPGNACDPPLGMELSRQLLRRGVKKEAGAGRGIRNGESM